MAAQHTPGPWIARDDGDGYAIEGYGDPAGTVCTLTTRRSVTGLADARLIAAAPELLAALESAIPDLERAATQEARSNKAPTGLPPKRDARARRDFARAAIAKARGEG